MRYFSVLLINLRIYMHKNKQDLHFLQTLLVFFMGNPHTPLCYQECIALSYSKPSASPSKIHISPTLRLHIQNKMDKSGTLYVVFPLSNDQYVPAIFSLSKTQIAIQKGYYFS